ncbi:acetyl/propionyl/methylcrotonyl-CoA carboxylase subunit alpha [Rubrobacter indicoceani]|uniref:acetyl/propionyl/methylcrotonyl-CoA carboxylase subunit alpha n=1 Tax=Rubrobacter indicoceani TaxID=2051957 RepID=UPI0013C48386|nr:biotin carboxylase N-terminal domain-containing protein [Rubrobacter indicoceani]
MRVYILRWVEGLREEGFVGFGKLLVANRGEIAVRVFRACRDLGIETVAVYSEADVGALHVREADEAYHIGGAPAAESYLNVANLVAAIHDSGADAVHPGYGFLSESAPFARAVGEAGAVWVGPTPEAMEKVGLKVRAKELAERAGVPTIPGYNGAEQAGERLAEEARRIGYPVLVKASAGGGGRGMREVRRPEDLVEAVRGAKREAESAFSDGTVFIEKLVEGPRHIEVQVVADHHGNVVHLYERECSIQRRHQKVVEEAPSPALPPEKRAEVCGAAVRLAREVGYTNAGTVEFLLSAEGEFYFLEMNARLQVEHPVTEAVTGLDLVKLQLAVAAGKELPVLQGDVTLGGSAVEVRVYAEDENGYPAGGRLLAFDPPTGVGIRNDSGVETGDEVPLFYDAMISKLIVRAPDRGTAVSRLAAALDEYTVVGTETNLPLLRGIAATPAFAAGETTTDFLEIHGPSGAAGEADPELLAFAAVAEASAVRSGVDPFAASSWRQLGLHSFFYGSEPPGRGPVKVEVERAVGGYLARLPGEEPLEVEVLTSAGGRAYLMLDGLPAHADAEPGGGATVGIGGAYEKVLRHPSPDGLTAAPESVAGGLLAPMPGTVVRLAVGEGEEVEEGQLIVVIEAMKMEQPIVAPHAGVVVRLPFAEGDLVSGSDVLAEIDKKAATEGMEKRPVRYDS